MELSVDVQLEGILFYRGSTVRTKELLTLLKVGEEELSTAVDTLKKRLHSGATRLIVTEDELQLVTAPELDGLIEQLRRDEMKRDIGKAGAETLAIVLYREPITRAEIEQIRGVNAGHTLRNLTTRGLIARRSSNTNTYSYVITPELLAHLGITHKTELPGYRQTSKQLDAFISTHHAETT